MKKPFTLLVVEDDRISLDLLHSMISVRYPNALIHYAYDGLSALQKFKEYWPDIVITDINMPEDERDTIGKRN